MSTTITIPARIVSYARDSLHQQFGMAAEAIADVSIENGRKQPKRYADPIERFDRIRAFLDFIGWKDAKNGGSAAISDARDRRLLLKALEDQLGVERDMMDEDPKLDGAEEQIRVATHRAQEIERFLWESAGELTAGRSG